MEFDTKQLLLSNRLGDLSLDPFCFFCVDDYLPANLYDDVIFTGRTVRSALDQIVDFGRPRSVRLGVLVDRGGREYPIRPDVAAETVEAADGQVIKVMLEEDDGRDAVLIWSKASV